MMFRLAIERGEQIMSATGPGSEQDGDQPSVPPRQDGQPTDADSGWEAEVARLVAAVDAGLVLPPAEDEGVPGTWFSLAGTSDPAEVDLAGLAKGGLLDARPPDAVLAAVTELACDPAVLAA